MYIKTERTNIRPFLGGDLNDLRTLCINDEAMRYIPPSFGAERLEQTFERLSNYIAHDEEHGISFGHVSLKNGTFIGRAGFYFVPEVNLYEIGYSLLPLYWGHGIATELTQGLLDYAFYSLNLDIVCARTLTGNLASEKVLQKTGFNYMGERTFASAGKTVLWNYYECDNPETLPSTTTYNNMAIADDGWDI
jgi:[ribosomal protein S5]-alanine N-acetyltransferase